MKTRDLSGMHYQGVEFSFSMHDKVPKQLRKIAKFFEDLDGIIIYSWTTEVDPDDENRTLVTVIYCV